MIPLPSHQQRLLQRIRPKQRVILHQEWKRLVALHWPVAAEEIQRTLPPGLFVDTYEGRAYAGMVAFAMSKIALPGCAFLAARPFLEFNLRTYVYDHQQRPGVWFYSLNANHRLGVAIARLFFHLQYRFASLRDACDERHASYVARRAGQEFGLSVGVLPEKRTAAEYSLEEFLFERYLYFTHGNPLWIGRICHAPYQLQSCREVHYDAALFRLDGLAPPQGAPCHAAYCEGLQVEAFWPVKSQSLP